MRKSKAITLSLLGLGTGLVAGCGGNDPAPAPATVEPVAERPRDDTPAETNTPSRTDGSNTKKSLTSFVGNPVKSDLPGSRAGRGSPCSTASRS